MYKKILDVKELLLEYPCLKLWTLNKAIREYNMPVIRIGRKRYFSTESINEWFTNLEGRENNG